jgi:site-specific DNA-methyltransferase (cytosine-N4-specific)
MNPVPQRKYSRSEEEIQTDLCSNSQYMNLPTQGQLLLPLLQTIHEAGGQAKPNKVYDALAKKIELPQWLRQLRALAGKAGDINVWERRVRNTRQYAAEQGFIENSPERWRRNLWELTLAGNEGLRNCQPGIIITVFTTDLGIALLAEAETAVQFIQDSSINLILTSPPYPLITQKAYGNRDPRAYVDWLTELAASWKQKLADTGSLVINLADVFNPGSPSVSLYQERLLINLCDNLGYSLAQKFYWENPSKLPSPAEWVCVRRIRVTPSIEQIYWLTKNPAIATANNRHILRPYSQSMLHRLAQGGEPTEQARPSGFTFKQKAFSTNNGGSIPHNLLIASNTESNDEYMRHCRQNNLPIHPARFPTALPDIMIRFLTEADQMVWDPFAGSGVTAQVAEALGRRWIINERSLTYLQGAALRFHQHHSLRTYFDQIAA